ncbi:hypothetical protein ACFE04_027865 [Oxalis oulophora]
MGEEKKEEVRKEEVAPPIEIVLKVDIYCEACAKKEVSTDSKASKVVVKGKFADLLKAKKKRLIHKKSEREKSSVTTAIRKSERENCLSPLISGRGCVIIYLNNTRFHVMESMGLRKTSVMKVGTKFQAARLYYVYPTFDYVENAADHVSCACDETSEGSTQVVDHTFLPIDLSPLLMPPRHVARLKKLFSLGLSSHFQVERQSLYGLAASLAGPLGFGFYNYPK